MDQKFSTDYKTILEKLGQIDPVEYGRWWGHLSVTLHFQRRYQYQASAEKRFRKRVQNISDRIVCKGIMLARLFSTGITGERFERRN